MISTILYHRTLKKVLSHFIQTKDLAMPINITMASAFHPASSNDIILSYSGDMPRDLGLLLSRYLLLFFSNLPTFISPLRLRNTLAVPPPFYKCKERKLQAYEELTVCADVQRASRGQSMLDCSPKAGLVRISRAALVMRASRKFVIVRLQLKKGIGGG